MPAGAGSRGQAAARQRHGRATRILADPV